MELFPLCHISPNVKTEIIWCFLSTCKSNKVLPVVLEQVKKLISIRPATTTLLNVFCMNKCGGTHAISLTGISLSLVLRQFVFSLSQIFMESTVQCSKSLDNFSLSQALCVFDMHTKKDLHISRTFCRKILNSYSFFLLMSHKTLCE